MGLTNEAFRFIEFSEKIIFQSLLFMSCSKGKAGTRRSSTETCEGCSGFPTTSTESHTG